MSGYIPILFSPRIFTFGGGDNWHEGFPPKWIPYNGKIGSTFTVPGDPEVKREHWWNRWYLRRRGFRRAAIFSTASLSKRIGCYIGRRVNGRVEAVENNILSAFFAAAVRHEDVEYFVLESWDRPLPIHLESMVSFDQAKKGKYCLV